MNVFGPTKNKNREISKVRGFQKHILSERQKQPLPYYETDYTRPSR